jgi:galactokinase
VPDVSPRAPNVNPVRAYSPGRVNLIGDHTDYNDGVALPMAVDLGTTVTFTPDGGGRIVLRSDHERAVADVALDVSFDPPRLRQVEPVWARFVAATVAAVRPRSGGTGSVATTIPIGAGLSSSTALVVALALALGLDAEPLAMARACQRAEQAVSIPGGIMDQLVVLGGRTGCALLIDFADLSSQPVAVPDAADVVVVHSGQSRRLDDSAYATRRAECEAAARGLGPLGRLEVRDVRNILDPLLRRRARHVTSECARVHTFAAALGAGDLAEAGQIMTASHRSLADDFEVSTPALDALVGSLVARPGVFGARLTGAGFGGCVVALTEPGALDVGAFPTPAWNVRASAGARMLVDA